MAAVQNHANGNGAAVRPTTKVAQAAEEEENIFLFIPNLIGTPFPSRLAGYGLMIPQATHASCLP